MRQRMLRNWLAAGAWGCLLLGCERAAIKHPYPPDPLLISKKPVEGKPDKAGPVLTAQAEPSAPAVPASAALGRGLETTPQHHSNLESPEKNGPSRPTLPAVPAVRSSISPEVPATPALRRRVPGAYGHAPDYSWLQGVLDKHYRGHLNLRYCEAHLEDTWGGKVCLEDDPRLAQVKEGDVVVVEGGIVRENGQPLRGTWTHFPRYRIRDIQLVQPKE